MPQPFGLRLGCRENDENVLNDLPSTAVGRVCRITRQDPEGGKPLAWGAASAKRTAAAAAVCAPATVAAAVAAAVDVMARAQGARAVQGAKAPGG